jgi:hypothetical protein
MNKQPSTVHYGHGSLSNQDIRNAHAGRLQEYAQRSVNHANLAKVYGGRSTTTQSIPSGRFAEYYDKNQRLGQPSMRGMHSPMIEAKRPSYRGAQYRGKSAEQIIYAPNMGLTRQTPHDGSVHRDALYPAFRPRQYTMTSGADICAASGGNCGRTFVPSYQQNLNIAYSMRDMGYFDELNLHEMLQNGGSRKDIDMMLIHAPIDWIRFDTEKNI